MNRSGLIAIVDEKGTRRRSVYHVVLRLRGFKSRKTNRSSSANSWPSGDPYTFSILTEAGGTVQFKDLQPGVTIEEQVDEVTGPLAVGRHALPPGR